MAARGDERLPGSDPSTARAGSWSTAVRRGLITWALCTSAYLLIAAVVQGLGLDRHRYPTSGPLSWPFRLYSRGDAGHFLGIARYGYFGPHSDRVTPAYFPGYPLLGRALAHLVHNTSVTGYLVALALVSWLGTATASVLFWKWAADELGQRTATYATVALLAGPYSVFLVSSYSEGPYLALAIGAWLAGKNQRWLIGSGLASLAAFTRISGAFLAVGLLTMFAQSVVHGRERRPYVMGPMLLLPFAAVLGYFAWLHGKTGSWTTWFTVERAGWGRHFVLPSTALTHSVRRLFTVHDADAARLLALRVQDTLELVFAVAFVVAVYFLVRRRWWPEAVYVGITAVSLLTSAYYLSVPRSLLVCFPVWLLVGQWLQEPRARLLALASAAIAVFNAASTLADHWAG